MNTLEYLKYGFEESPQSLAWLGLLLGTLTPTLVPKLTMASAIPSALFISLFSRLKCKILSNYVFKSTHPIIPPKIKKMLCVGQGCFQKYGSDQFLPSFLFLYDNALCYVFLRFGPQNVRK